MLAVPKRESEEGNGAVRLFGVGGKRADCQESFLDCAWREGKEEIGDVIAQIDSAAQTYLLQGHGTLKAIELSDQLPNPQLIWAKYCHSPHGSMAASNQAYYLVAFNAQLAAQPKPLNEIAALIYLKDKHLAQIHHQPETTLRDLLAMGARVDCQPGSELPLETRFIPHGTVHFLLRQQE